MQRNEPRAQAAAGLLRRVKRSFDALDDPKASAIYKPVVVALEDMDTDLRLLLKAYRSDPGRIPRILLRSEADIRQLDAVLKQQSPQMTAYDKVTG